LISLFNALRGKEKFTGRHLLALSAFLVLILLFTGFSVSYTSSTSFCANCHEMEPFRQSWSLSSHKNVDCIECHSAPGLEGVVKTKANGLKQLYLHVTQSEFNPKAPPNDIHCLSCHQERVKTDTDLAEIRKNPHTVKHFENGMNCLSCHTGMVHNEKLNNALPSRDICVTCHLDQMKK